MLFIFSSCEAFNYSTVTLSTTLQQVKVERIVDGDTIKISIGDESQSLRYIGMDTPETVDPRKPVEFMGKEASAKNKELVEKKTVYIEYDIEKTDQYKRLLGYVWLENSTTDLEKMVNYLLVKLGYASVATYPPNVKYQSKFIEAQKFAVQNELGLWKKK
jgi:micrococcal nuclease